MECDDAERNRRICFIGFCFVWHNFLNHQQDFSKMQQQYEQAY